MSGATATAIGVGIASSVAGAVVSKAFAGKAPKQQSFAPAAPAAKAVDPNIAAKATGKLEAQQKAAATGTRFAGRLGGQRTGETGDTGAAPVRRSRLLGGASA